MPNRGAIAVSLNENDVRNTFEVMAGLEALSGELAAQRITDEELAEIRAMQFEMMAAYTRRDLSNYYRINALIHKAINAAAKNPVLTATYNQVNARLQALRFRSNQNGDKWERAAKEHEKMIDALAAHDSARDARGPAEPSSSRKARRGAGAVAARRRGHLLRSGRMNTPLPLKVARTGSGSAYDTVAKASNEVAGLLARRLAAEGRGDVLFSPADRGRYATDASIYQVMPIGVFVPRSSEDVKVALDICRDLKVPIVPRGGGTSQCGQTVGAGLVIDHSRHVRNILHFDAERRTAEVEPGMVLDHLNSALKKLGLWYPVDVSTSAQATLGGMAGNNSCGSRSIAYGNMVHNVLGAQAWTSDGEAAPLRALRGQRGRRARAGTAGPGAGRRAGAGNRPALAQGAAPGGRLQPGHLPQPEPAVLYRGRLGQPGAPAGGQRRNAGGHQVAHPPAGRAARREGAGRRQLPHLLQGDGLGPAHRQAGSRASLDERAKTAPPRSPRSNWSTAP